MNPLTFLEKYKELSSFYQYSDSSKVVSREKEKDDKLCRIFTNYSDDEKLEIVSLPFIRYEIANKEKEGATKTLEVLRDFVISIVLSR